MTKTRQPKRELAARAYLWTAAIVFICLGIALLLRPAEILSSVEVTFESATAFADIRADYGGCILGIGVFLVGCAWYRNLVGAGLMCVGLVFSGYVLGRVLSLALDGVPNRIIFVLLAIETVGALLAFSLFPYAAHRPARISLENRNG